MLRRLIVAIHRWLGVRTGRTHDDCPLLATDRALRQELLAHVAATEHLLRRIRALLGED